MNLEKLFKMQKELDERILDRFPELRNEDLLDKKILALQVELGELAQNWRGFKFWKDNPKPRTEKIKRPPCKKCEGVGYFPHENGITEDDCNYCNGEGSTPKIIGNPLLEEYVDCLHFILGIGNDFNLDIKNTNPLYELDDITHLFSELISTAGAFNSGSRFIKENYKLWIGHFVSLGKKLGFTWEQVEQAYYQKNEINHERQDNGY